MSSPSYVLCQCTLLCCESLCEIGCKISDPRQGIVNCVSLNLWQRVVDIRVHIGLLPQKSLHFHFSRAYFPLSFNATACYVMFLWGRGWKVECNIWRRGRIQFPEYEMEGEGKRLDGRTLGLLIPVALKPTVHEMEDIMWYSWKGTSCADSVFSRACIDAVEMQWPYALRQYCSDHVGGFLETKPSRTISEPSDVHSMSSHSNPLLVFEILKAAARAHDIRYKGCARVVFLHHFAYIICVFLPDQHETRSFSSPSHVLDPFNIWKLESIVEY